MTHNWNNRSLRGLFGMCWVVLLGIAASHLSAQDAPPAEAALAAPELAPAAPAVDRVLSEQYQRALIIDFDGPIFGSQHAYLTNRLNRAQRAGVDVVIIRLTSPGGLLEESLQLAPDACAISTGPRPSPTFPKKRSAAGRSSPWDATASTCTPAL